MRRFLVAVLIIFFYAHVYANDEIRFGVFAYKGVEKTRAQYQPLVDHLNEKLNKRIVLEVLTQDELNAKIKNQELDIVTTNPAHFLYIRQTYALSGVLATLSSFSRGIATDKLGGVIIVNKNSKFSTIFDLKNKTIMAPSKKHLGGFGTQAYEFLLNGIDILDGDTKIIETKGTHQEVVHAIMRNRAQVGFIRDGILEEMVAKGEIKEGDVKIINKQQNSSHPYKVSTKLYPEWPIFSLPYANEQDVRLFLASILTLKPTPKLQKVGINSFSLPADYLPVEELSRKLKLPPYDKVIKPTFIDILGNYKGEFGTFLAILLTILFFYAREKRRKGLLFSLLSNMGDGVYGVDKNGNCTWINSKALELLGYKESEVLYKNQHALFHHHRMNAKRYYEHECPVFLTSHDKKARRLDEYFIRKDGSFFPISLTVTPSQDGGAIVVFRDITESKKQEQSLKETNSLLESLLQSIPDLVWMKDKDGVYLTCNRRFEDFFGTSREEIVGKTDYDFVPKDLADFFREHDRSAMESKTSLSNFEEIPFASDGHFEYLQTIKTAVMGMDNSIVGVLGIGRDLTDLRSKQEELKSSEELLDLFFSQSIYGFFFMMLDEPIEWSDSVDKEKALDYVFDHQHITKINDAMLEQYGAKKEDFIGYTPRDFFTHNLAEGRAVWRELFDCGRLHIDTNEKRIDGSEIVIDGDYICLYNDEGKITGHFGVQREVTEDRVTKKALVEAKNSAEKATIAKSQFLANMSHEIRTPMNAILGFSDLLLFTQLDAKQQDYIHKIHASSKMLLGIINDILDYSKIEANKLEIEHKEFNLENALHQLRAIFVQNAFSKGVALTFKSLGEVPKIVVGDELRLNQVLANLLSNALKFTHAGEVSLVLELVQKDEKHATIKFSVKDSGIGMEESYFAKLFDPFTQADTSTTRKYGGTGLGLSISSKLVAAMGGIFDVQSKIGVGSIFSFSLAFGINSWEANTINLQNANLQTKELAQLEYPDLSHIKILLVEDNIINQEVALAMLKRANISADIANNGKEAVRMFLSKPKQFDLILMDLQMPVMSGYEATSIIREHNKKIPIIALSAAAMIEDKEKVLKSGMNDHLSKPVDADELIRTIVSWCDKTLEIESKAKKIDSSPDAIFDFEYMKRTINANDELQERLLRSFLSELNGEFKDVIDAVKKGNTDAKTLIHSIKGVSANLGAKALANIATKLDVCYKKSQTIQESDIEALEKILTQTKEVIESNIAKFQKIVEIQTLSDDELKTLFKEIKEDAMSANMISQQKQQIFFDAMSSKVNSHELQKCKDAMGDFDYDEVLNIISGWEI